MSLPRLNIGSRHARYMQEAENAQSFPEKTSENTHWIRWQSTLAHTDTSCTQDVNYVQSPVFTLKKRSTLNIYQTSASFVLFRIYTPYTHTLVSTLDRVANNSKKYAIMVKILGHSRVANHSAIGHNVWYCLQISNLIRKSTIPSQSLATICTNAMIIMNIHITLQLYQTVLMTSYKLLTLWAHDMYLYMFSSWYWHVISTLEYTCSMSRLYTLTPTYSNKLHIPQLHCHQAFHRLSY